jgi:hypothetical protein
MEFYAKVFMCLSDLRDYVRINDCVSMFDEK